MKSLKNVSFYSNRFYDSWSAIRDDSEDNKIDSPGNKAYLLSKNIQKEKQKY